MQRTFRRLVARISGRGGGRRSGAARADDDYPNHAVRWLVGYPPGGSTDICARLIGQYLSEHLHQQFVVENKPGAGNNLGTEIAAHSPPDGYTVFLVNPANAINATLYKNLPFDFLRDMTPVAGFIRVPNVMEVNPNVPAHTVEEFIDYAKASPGKVNMASSGIGTSVHLSGALFMMMTGVELVHVPYRGAAPALDRSARQPSPGDVRQSAVLDRAHPSRAAARARGDDGTARRRRCRTCRPSPRPCPATKRAPGSAWRCRKERRATIIEKLNRAVNDALADPDMQAKLAELGGILIPGTPEDFGKVIADETDKWAKVVKATGATAE